MLLLVSTLAAGPAVAQGAPTIEAFPRYDSVEAMGFPADATLTLEIFDGATRVFGPVVEQADPSGNHGFFLDDGGDEPLDLTAGHLVRVSDGTTTKEVTVEPLSIQLVDLELERVTGTATAGKIIEISTFDEAGIHGSEFQEVTPSPGGAWQADFTQLTTTTRVHTRITDTEGDRTAVDRLPPRIRVTMDGYQLGPSVCAGEFASGALVTLELVEDGGAGRTIFAGTLPADDNGELCLGIPGDFPVVPGTFVSASDGVYSTELLVPELTLDVIDPLNDAVSGTAVPGATLSILPDGISLDEADASVQADEVTGEWTKNLSGLADIAIDSGVTAFFFDPEGDNARAEKAGRFLDVDPTYGLVRASNFAANSSVTFEVYDGPRGGGGILVDSGSVPDDGFGNAQFETDPLTGGMVVVATDGLGERSVVIPDVTIDAVDPVADTASGTAEPLAELGVASHCGLTEQGVTANASGDWSANYGGDFRHAAFVCTGGPADVAEPDVPGGGVSPSLAVPLVSVDPSTDLVSADGFTPGDPVTFEIFETPVSGTPLNSASRPTQSSFDVNGQRSPGHAEWPADLHGVPLEAGMFVRATQATTVKELTIAAFTVDVADPLANVVAGTAEIPAGGLVVLSVDRQLTVKPDVAAGAWEVDIAALPRPTDCAEPDCPWPYPWGLDSNVEASVVDAEGDRTELTEGAAELAGGVAGPGGTVTTDTEADGATVEDPVETAVTTPTGGPVTIREEQQTQQAPSSFAFLGQQIDIDAPVETANNPLEIEVRVDARRVPAGESAATLQIFRNSAFVPECAGAPGAATPSPCIREREDLSDGDVRLTMLSAQASEWNAGASNDARPPTLGTPSFSVNPKPQEGTSVLSATAGDALTGVGGGEYFVGSDPGPGEGTAMLLDGSTLTATIGTDLASGSYDVGIRARDRAGNWSPVTTLGLTVIQGSGPPGSPPPPPPDVDARCGDPGVVCGTDGDDQLTGTNGDDVILSGDGNDSIAGGGGNDTIVGGAGSDTLLGGEGDDTLLGGDGDDTCDGGAGNDVIDCSAGNDLLLGGSGSDDLRSTTGADRLVGQAGDDTIAGGAGSDVLRGGSGDDQVFGQTGSDRLLGGSGRDYLGAGGEDDLLNGGVGRDRMFGNGGSDVLLARDGFADGVNGGRGRDRARTDGLDTVRSVP